MAQITFDFDETKYHEIMWLRILGDCRYLKNDELEKVLEMISSMRQEKFKRSPEVKTYEFSR